MLKELLQNPLFLPQIIKNQEIGAELPSTGNAPIKAANVLLLHYLKTETTKLMAEMPMITL